MTERTMTGISIEDRELIRKWSELAGQSHIDFVSDAIREYIAVNGNRIKELARKRIEAVDE